jgi:hypothetical protein
MIEMIGAELFKLRKRGMTWILLAILLALFSALIFFTTYEPDYQFTDVFAMIISTAANMEILLLIILVGSSVGNEYGWGSVRQVMIKRGVREQFVLSKLISLIIVAAIGLLICIVIGLILVLITSGLNDNINWNFITVPYIGELFCKFGLALLSLLPYILLTALFFFPSSDIIPGFLFCFRCFPVVYVNRYCYCLVYWIYNIVVLTSYPNTNRKFFRQFFGGGDRLQFYYNRACAARMLT